MKHKTQKRPKPKIVRTRHYTCKCAMAVLIIFPLILQSSIS